MKTAIIVISLLLIASLFVVSCTKEADTTPQQDTGSELEPESETTGYIASQLVDQNEEVEIGEMI